MRQKSRKRVRQFMKAVSPRDHQRLDRIKINNLGFGYDSFGLELESVMLAFGLGQFFYKYWFRVESEGIEFIPEEGPVLLAANHSGGIPIDGVGAS